MFKKLTLISLVIAMMTLFAPPFTAPAQAQQTQQQQIASGKPKTVQRLGTSQTALDLNDVVGEYTREGFAFWQSPFVVFDAGLGFPLLRDTRYEVDPACRALGGTQQVFGGALQASGPNNFFVDGVVNCLAGSNWIYMRDDVREYRYYPGGDRVVSYTGEIFVGN